MSARRKARDGSPERGTQPTSLGADSMVDDGLNPFAFYDLRDSLPAYAALAVLFAADAALDDLLAVGLVVIAAIVGVFASLAYLDAGQRGAARRQVRQRFDAGLDATERRARRAAATVPLGGAVVIAAIASGGLPDVGVVAVVLAIGFVLSQVIFALWLNARDPGQPRA